MTQIDLDASGDLVLFWAKSIDDGQDSLSLIQHASDVAGIIVEVADGLVPAGRLDILQEALGDVPLENVLQFAAWAHDSGKISAYFQPKVPNLYSRVRRAGYRSQATPRQLSANHHSLISAVATRSWFRSRSSSRPDRRSLRGWGNVLGGHHGAFPTSPELPDLALEPENWQEARERFLDLGVSELGLDQGEIDALASVPWSVADQVLITGILIAADWVGSSENYFPYEDETIGEGSIYDSDRLFRAIEQLDLGGRWKPQPISPENFGERFGLPDGAQMRNVQEVCVNIALEQDLPALHLIENETGSGKTEAALAMAEILAKKFDLEGIFFAQPTRITSDAMFSRVADWIDSGADSGHPVSTILAHGKAEFNEEYESLFAGARPQAIYDFEDSHVQSGLEATQWFRGRKTGLLASVVVGTIDQMLMAALRSKHAMLRHLGLAGKVVIIDEIHAADDFMRVYLTRILEWLGLYGVPVIALSATLPPDQRKELTDAYRRGATQFSGIDITPNENIEYPRVTTADSHDVQTKFPKPDGRIRKTAVEFLEGDLPELAEAISKAASDGGCIAAICSTVNRAQELYEMLREGTVEVVLLHSRFTTDHRFELETRLVNQLGRNAEHRPEGFIVVSTQIIEQGLDLDFDLMYSDIAPLDLLIQRMGRLHRHESLNTQRPLSMKNPKMIITGAGIPDESASAPDFPRGLVAVYREAPLLRSAFVLARHLDTHAGIVEAPAHVAGLVAEAYEELLIGPDTWTKAWDKAQRKDEEFRSEQNERAKLHLVPSASTGSLNEWSASLTPTEEQQGIAQVRDADESFEVIVVQQIGGRLYALPHVCELEGITVDGTTAMEWSVAKVLARSTVRLPGWMVKEESLRELENDGQESWQESAWLAGQLPLVLDENLQRELGEYLLSYDHDRGLLMEKIVEGNSDV